MKKTYDLAIIGGGPAGLSAAIYAGRAKLRVLIIEKGEIGGQVNTTYEIANYPGARDSTGPKLMGEMTDQAKDFGTTFIHAEVSSVDLEGDEKILKTDKGDIKARAVVIASGAKPRKLGIKGEEEFTGRGVAYCATCDGELFDGLEVFVVGAGYAAAEEAIFLTKFASKVTVIVRKSEFSCAKTIADKVLNHPKIEVKFNTELLEVSGERMINHARFYNNISKEEWDYKVREGDAAFGVFIFVGYVPESHLFKDVLSLDERGYIKTDENMQTDVKGVYAAGDIRPKDLRQIVTAVSDGAIAATVAEKYVVEVKERLGIEDDYSEEETQEQVQEIKSQDLGQISRKSKLLNDEMRSQLKGVLDKVESKVTLVSIVDESLEKSIELKSLVLDIADLSENVKAEIYKKGENTQVESKINADKLPVVALLDSNDNYSGVKFHGVPGGHELNSFILAIYNLGGPGQEISEDILKDIKKIDKDINIKVCVSLSCHLCPEVVVGAQRIAIENENVEAEMIDVSNFKDLKDQYQIMSVPAMIINDDQVHFGAKRINEIIDIIKQI